ncbi:hypothetical protein FGG08_002222 [Glutinoglossum americanum]|uniref:Nudix hydrolase domain-containing protein n=1 Tax=Glutinoglossum americanum TaxID=1670608 RepID=A0A9P8L1X3_9PEZI|nr:hypothetical protein FGG08_002222 [Glutinoglossum americanum]
MSNPVPISIHIPPDLQPLAVPLRTWLREHPNYDRLAIGALIFAYDAEPRILLVQRAAAERAFPGCWEIPGGSVEASDPTILHSVAREVFEETGLRLTRFVRQVGDGTEFVTRGGSGGSRRWLKLDFEIEAAEMPVGMQAKAFFDTSNDTDTSSGLEDIPIILDPEEHQFYGWATETDVDKSFEDEGKYTFISPDQRHVMLDGFGLHKADRERVKRDFERVRKLMENA